MIELVREMVVEMLHTREGTKVALQCLWYGTAKVSETRHHLHTAAAATAVG